MANAYKVLGQQNPAATTNTDLYTVPASTSSVVSTITICNQATVAGKFRVAVRPAGASILAKHYLAYDSDIAANDTVALTLGVTLATTDVITVYATASTMSFNAFGTEIT